MPRDPEHEIRRRYEAQMGAELGSLFAELWQELAWLHTVWQEYRAIYGTSPERLEIANRAAGTFFYVIQKALWEAVLLHLARLTDPPQSHRKRNLSVTALSGVVEPTIRGEVDALTESALEVTAFARDWRNRYIAHKDLPLALGDQTALALQPASRTDVETALKALGELLNIVDRKYTDSTTMFQGIEPLTGARRLLDVLDKGLKAEEAEHLEFRRQYGL